ncbi:probable inactive serine/threonine-protein kinase slob2 [Phoenix dactylifera]|uniref:Probable inactive serine/threonine-protein kinase slob2 n=1 Tax=Phoenix dactylifera TaxID=42345 RepID=A0A8B9AG03_PHODC|nr:probable inactive serine/threonine-protein kinase slob2 [Phoenix dactylifera]
MEKKETTTSSHKGMCEKVFDAFNPGSRPHRRLALHGQEPEATTNPSPNHSLGSAIKEPSPQKKPRPPTTDQKKPSEAIAPKSALKPTTPPPPPISVPVQKASDKAVPTPAARKAATIPQPAPPKAAATAADEGSKKNINEKVEDYIKRVKEKIRSVSGVGRTPNHK